MKLAPKWRKIEMVASSSTARVLAGCLDRVQLAAWRHIEFQKQALMHWFEIWHMKLDTECADFGLMQSVQIIRAPTWVDQKRQDQPKKGRKLQSG